MKHFSYEERDYGFGQAMLTLRTSLGLTQAGLAQRLGVSRRTVGEWEAGSNYPKANHLKHLLELAVRVSAFAAGREEEEIRALWKAAHQKVLLDEVWLSALLTQPSLPSVSVPVEEAAGAAVARTAPASSLAQAADSPQSGGPLASRSPSGSGPRLDWGDALDMPSFYGREQELATLTRWVLQERCRVVSVLGLGGIGKSALAVSLMHQVAEHFEVVLWRSLRDAPECSALLEDCLQVLAPQPLGEVPASFEGCLRLLLEQLRARRALLVLDNLETLLEEGEGTGRMRAGYEGYGQLLRRVGETAHQSCLLLTSREKSADLDPLEGSRMPVRALRLVGLEATACEDLLVEHEVVGSPEEQARLVERYGGNPLALHIVAETIADLFGGVIGPFLAQDTAVFGNIADLLAEQWRRLSSLERTLLCWLAIVREPVTLEELLSVLVSPRPRVQVLEAVNGLRRRSLIERGQRVGSFTLQSVVLEYVTAWLIAQASREIEQGHLDSLITYGFCQAQAKEYIRAIQEHLLVAPLLTQVQRVYQGQANVKARLLWLLDELRGLPQASQGYGSANVVALLRLLRGDLRGLDFTQLSLRGVYLQGVQMQDTTLAGALMRESVFTENFDASWTVAISRNGQYWAAGSKRGEVRVWQEGGQTLHRIWQAHTDIVPTIAFSPDGHTLASGSYDGSVKLWEVASGDLLWTGWHTHSIYSVAFAPDGSLLASGGNDATVRIWDRQSGTQLQMLSHPDPVFEVAWSPDGYLLASGGLAGQIRLWQIEKTQPATCIQTLAGHTNWVVRLAFAPDGRTLASGSHDGTVKLWDVESLRLLQTLAGHTDRVLSLAWSPDAGTLASGGGDTTIRLWDAQQGSARAVLQGHTAEVYYLAFTPDSRSLFSGSDDGTLRVWEVESGQCVRLLQGYAVSLSDIAWSPDGTHLVSGGTDTLVIIWDVTAKMPPRVLRGHSWTVFGVGWSPGGSRLASSGWDMVIRLWDPTTGSCVQVLSDSDDPTIFFGVAWSPDGHWLASGTYMHGVLVWEVTTRRYRWVGRELPTLIRCVAWSPDGTRLVGGGDDGQVYLWGASDGTLLQKLSGHSGGVTRVAWHSDGKQLASGGGGREGGELFVWDVQSGERVRAFAGHEGVVSAATWGPGGERLISGGSDGVLRWWQVHTGVCVRVQKGHQGTIRSLKVSPDGSRLASCGDDGAIMLWDLDSGEPLQTLRRDRPYERLNITGIRGLTEAQKASLRALGAIEEMEDLLKG